MLADKFEEMYRENYRMLRNAAYNVIGDHDASHDVVQEVFVKLWQKKESVDIILNQKAYLYRSVINASITYLQNNKSKIQLEDYRSEAEGRADSGLLLRELEFNIAKALDKLPPKCRAVFVLSRYEERKNKEIAEILGLSIKTVENQMGIALKKMREELKPYLAKDIFKSGSVAVILFLLVL
jgi:RNA polymerase sigma-70 factor, ECF subfamily